MFENWKQSVPGAFSDDSRVWIYQSNRSWCIEEIKEIESMLGSFVASWLSHGATVKAHATLLFGQFIVLVADEQETSVSGCSTDSSVKLIKDIEKRFGIQMFDRMNLAFFVQDKVQLVPLSQFNTAVQQGHINAGTLYFNNTVANKSELLKRWLIPVSDSWLAGRLAQSAAPIV